MHFSGGSLELSVFNSLSLSRFFLGLKLSFILPVQSNRRLWWGRPQGHKEGTGPVSRQVIYFLSLRKMVPINLGRKKQWGEPKPHAGQLGTLYLPEASQQGVSAGSLKRCFCPTAALQASQSSDCLRRSHALGKQHTKPTQHQSWTEHNLFFF